MTDDQETVELPTEPLAQHVLQQAIEGWHSLDGGGHVSIDDGVDYELFDATDNVEHVDAHDGGVHVHATITGTVSEKVARATRTNPPAYESHDIEIRVVAEWHPTNQLAPETYLLVEQVGANPLAPPDVERY